MLNLEDTGTRLIHIYRSASLVHLQTAGPSVGPNQRADLSISSIRGTSASSVPIPALHFIRLASHARTTARRKEQQTQTPRRDYLGREQATAA